MVIGDDNNLCINYKGLSSDLEDKEVFRMESKIYSVLNNTTHSDSHSNTRKTTESTDNNAIIIVNLETSTKEIGIRRTDRETQDRYAMNTSVDMKKR